MAGSFSNFLELEVLDHVFGAAVYTAPATLYIALYTVAPTDAAGGTEVTGGAYARKDVANNATNFPAMAGASTCPRLLACDASASFICWSRSSQASYSASISRS